MKLVKYFIDPHTLQKVSVPFTDGDVNKRVQKALNSLNLVNETPQTCKVERGH